MHKTISLVLERIFRVIDIGRQDRFKFIRSTFYKGAKGAILVFDLSKPSTWENMKDWMNEIKTYGGNIPFLVIGNKLELLSKIVQVIDREACRSVVEDCGNLYIETESNESLKVFDAVAKLTQRILEKET
ncbi:MAG: hypothetical protein GF364_05490 [Candidatus Lokiarchaeota archaeon]|nr:hypothetical protein [Candidatus Lokiarchaeota archaeon]